MAQKGFRTFLEPIVEAIVVKCDHYHLFWLVRCHNAGLWLVSLRTWSLLIWWPGSTQCIATDQFISGLLCPDVSSQFENWSPIWVSFILPGRAGRACYKNSLTEQLISKRLASNCVNCSHHQPSAHTKHLPSSSEIVKSMRDRAL